MANSNYLFPQKPTSYTKVIYCIALGQGLSELCCSAMNDLQYTFLWHVFDVQECWYVAKLAANGFFSDPLFHYIWLYGHFQEGGSRFTYTYSFELPLSHPPHPQKQQQKQQQIATKKKKGNQMAQAKLRWKML